MSNANYHHKSKDSPLTTLDEVQHERSNMTRSVSTILNTVENIQAATEEFQEHVAMLNEKMKHEVLAKIKDLKRADTQLLTERVRSFNINRLFRSKNSNKRKALN
jgi:peptidoglycan hydrolase CwlO-like protein